MGIKNKNLFKKRFILLGALCIILGVIIVDKIQLRLAKEHDAESIEQFEQSIGDADSTLVILNEAEDRLISLYQQEYNDNIEIDSLKNILKHNDSLNKDEKYELLEQLDELERQRREHDEEITILTSVEMDTVIINVITTSLYDTIYIDTIVYNYIDSSVVIRDTVLMVDTIIIDNPKHIKKILKKYNK